MIRGAGWGRIYTEMIQDERVQALNDGEVAGGSYVVYWMQQAARADCNHALEYAVRRANELQLPVVAAFGITQRFPGANERHYAFMLEGLAETRSRLAERGIGLVVRLSPPVELILGLAGEAALVVTDRGYLKIQRNWRRRAAQRAACRVEQVETDVVVPVETASDEEQWAARTLRPRIHEHLDRFLAPLEETSLERDSVGLVEEGLELDDVEGLLEEMRVSRSAGPVSAFRGGASRAERLLEEFCADRLPGYAESAGDPNAECVSHMSPYLHFGQISPLRIALRVSAEEGAGRKNIDAYLKELIVRRELSMNFCLYNGRYDSFACLPEWARQTLRQHAGDERPYLYSREELAKAGTHDPYWNAAQRRMMQTGKMHNRMRMYWGKKILEWTADPEEAFRTALELNNRYELDGRDPNSYAGVAWCFGKHDQGWAERDVFGKVRYMNAAGLERKFDAETYVRETPGAGG